MIIATDTITLRALPSISQTDDFGNYTDSNVIEYTIKAQVVINKTEYTDLPDNSETLRVQFVWNAEILDITRYRIVFKNREYQIDNQRTSAVLQPNVIKLDCSLIRE